MSSIDRIKNTATNLLQYAEDTRQCVEAVNDVLNPLQDKIKIEGDDYILNMSRTEYMYFMNAVNRLKDLLR